jgi:cyanophycin synthetase
VPDTLPAVNPNAVNAADLQVSRVRALRGPNYWRLAPVIACDVRLGDLEQVTTADVVGFTDRLLEALPSLREHPCSREKPGGLVERLIEGTSWPHVLEHVATRAPDPRRHRRELRPSGRIG